MVLRKSYLDKIIPFIDQDLIKVLVGIRRCGKTVLLGQIKDVLLQRNIPAQNIIQANFESMRFRNTRTAETLYDYIAEKAEGCTGKIYILLDEIQEVERWQIAINSLRVDFDCDIYLTGSNSKLLSGELATYLSGRYIQIQIFPFSLAEAKQQCIENGTYTSDEKLFADYLKYGGFPQRFFLLTIIQSPPIWTIFTRLSLSVTSCYATIFANRPHYVMSLHSCWTISAIRFLPVISVDAWFRKESRQPLLPY